MASALATATGSSAAGVTVAATAFVAAASAAGGVVSSEAPAQAPPPPPTAPTAARRSASMRRLVEVGAYPSPDGVSPSPADASRRSLLASGSTSSSDAPVAAYVASFVASTPSLPLAVLYNASLHAAMGTGNLSAPPSATSLADGLRLAGWPVSDVELTARARPGVALRFVVAAPASRAAAAALAAASPSASAASLTAGALLPLPTVAGLLSALSGASAAQTALAFAAALQAQWLSSGGAVAAGINVASATVAAASAGAPAPPALPSSDQVVTLSLADLAQGALPGVAAAVAAAAAAAAGVPPSSVSASVTDVELSASLGIDFSALSAASWAAVTPAAFSAALAAALGVAPASRLEPAGDAFVNGTQLVVPFAVTGFGPNGAAAAAAASSALGNLTRCAKDNNLAHLKTHISPRALPRRLRVSLKVGAVLFNVSEASPAPALDAEVVVTLDANATAAALSPSADLLSAVGGPGFVNALAAAGVRARSVVVSGFTAAPSVAVSSLSSAAGNGTASAGAPRPPASASAAAPAPVRAASAGASVVAVAAATSGCCVACCVCVARRRRATKARMIAGDDYADGCSVEKAAAPATAKDVAAAKRARASLTWGVLFGGAAEPQPGQTRAQQLLALYPELPLSAPEKAVAWAERRVSEAAEPVVRRLSEARASVGRLSHVAVARISATASAMGDCMGVANGDNDDSGAPQPPPGARRSRRNSAPEYALASPTMPRAGSVAALAAAEDPLSGSFRRGLSLLTLSSGDRPATAGTPGGGGGALTAGATTTTPPLRCAALVLASTPRAAPAAAGGAPHHHPFGPPAGWGPGSGVRREPAALDWPTPGGTPDAATATHANPFFAAQQHQQQRVSHASNPIAAIDDDAPRRSWGGAVAPLVAARRASAAAAAMVAPPAAGHPPAPAATAAGRRVSSPSRPPGLPRFSMAEPLAGTRAPQPRQPPASPGADDHGRPASGSSDGDSGESDGEEGARDDTVSAPQFWKNGLFWAESYNTVGVERADEGGGGGGAGVAPRADAASPPALSPASPAPAPRGTPTSVQPLPVRSGSGSPVRVRRVSLDSPLR